MLDSKPSEPDVAFKETIEFYKKAFIEVNLLIILLFYCSELVTLGHGFNSQDHTPS